MKAETAYDVIQALPKEELKRLYALLDVRKKAESKPILKKRGNSISLEDAIELILKKAISKQNI